MHDTCIRFVVGRLDQGAEIHFGFFENPFWKSFAIQFGHCGVNAKESKSLQRHRIVVAGTLGRGHWCD